MYTTTARAKQIVPATYLKFLCTHYYYTTTPILLNENIGLLPNAPSGFLLNGGTVETCLFCCYGLLIWTETNALPPDGKLSWWKNNPAFHGIAPGSSNDRSIPAMLSHRELQTIYLCLPLPTDKLNQYLFKTTRSQIIKMKNGRP